MVAMTMQELFDALKQSPVSIDDQIKVERAEIGTKQVNAHLFPKADLFARYDYTSAPTGMIPVAPNDLVKMVQVQNEPQPFSQNIFRLGALVNVPVFSMSLYSTAKKAKLFVKTAQEKQKINLLKNEALLVGFNADLQYIDAMFRALKHHKQSLMKTKEIVRVKVDTGRIPATALLKIDDAIHRIKVAMSELDVRKSGLISMISAKTGIHLSHAIPMTATTPFQRGNFAILKPLIEQKKASIYSLKSAKYRLIPSLVATASYNHSIAPAYNVDKWENEDFFSFGLILKIPLFNMTQYQSVSEQKIRVKLMENNLKKESMALAAQADNLTHTFSVIEKQILLYKQSVKNKKKLLKISTAAYASNRMPIEDYLQYEDAVLMEESNYYKSMAKRWHTIVTLAVIYGNTIEEMVK